MKLNKHSKLLTVLSCVFMVSCFSTAIHNNNYVNAEAAVGNYTDVDPSYFYDDITADSGELLLGQLHDLLVTKHRTYNTYDDIGKKGYLAYTDVDPNNPSNIIDFYSGYSYTNVWDPNHTGHFNREHLWCQSLSIDVITGNQLWGTKYGGADIHHLRPIELTSNSSRNNSPYGEIVDHTANTKKYIKDTSGNLILDGGQFGYYDEKLDIFEPMPNKKGDIARIIFYVYTHYTSCDYLTNATTDGVLENGTSCGKLDITKVMAPSTEESCWDLLTKWNNSDPVDELEQYRNNIAAKYTGTRNPYIDHPEYANYIWGNTEPYISLVAKNIKIVKGESISLNGKIINGTGTITYTSDDNSVATVDQLGNVTTVDFGTTTIHASATINNKVYNASCDIEVISQKVPVTGVSLNTSTINIEEGETYSNLIATVAPANATNKILIWTSSNERSVEVTEEGIIKAKVYGSSTVTVQTLDGNKKATCTVNVNFSDNYQWELIGTTDQLNSGDLIIFGTYDDDVVNGKINNSGMMPISCEYTKNKRVVPSINTSNTEIFITEINENNYYSFKLFSEGTTYLRCNSTKTGLISNNTSGSTKFWSVNINPYNQSAATLIPIFDNELSNAKIYFNKDGTNGFRIGTSTYQYLPQLFKRSPKSSLENLSINGEYKTNFYLNEPFSFTGYINAIYSNDAYYEIHDSSLFNISSPNTSISGKHVVTISLDNSDISVSYNIYVDSGVYYLVNDENILKEGDYVSICSIVKDDVTLSTFIDTNNIKKINISLDESNRYITSIDTSAYQMLTFKLIKNGNYWRFEYENENNLIRYLTATESSDKNYLKLKTLSTLSDADTVDWSIDISSDGAATIISNTPTTRYLRYNTPYSLFSTYKTQIESGVSIFMHLTSVRYSEIFLNNKITCDGHGATTFGLSNWTDMSDMFDALPEDCKLSFKNAVANENGTLVEQCVARYDAVVQKYSAKYDNFMDRNIQQSRSLSAMENNAKTIMLTSVVLIALSATITFFVINKKKKA